MARDRRFTSPFRFGAPTVMSADVLLLDAAPVADITVLKHGDHLTRMIKDGRIVDFGEENP